MKISYEIYEHDTSLMIWCEKDSAKWDFIFSKLKTQEVIIHDDDDEVGTYSIIIEDGDEYLVKTYDEIHLDSKIFVPERRWLYKRFKKNVDIKMRRRSFKNFYKELSKYPAVDLEELCAEAFKPDRIARRVAEYDDYMEYFYD